jgi:hypothetical protein
LRGHSGGPGERRSGATVRIGRGSAGIQARKRVGNVRRRNTQQQVFRAPACLRGLLLTELTNSSETGERFLRNRRLCKRTSGPRKPSDDESCSKTSFPQAQRPLLRHT